MDTQPNPVLLRRSDVEARTGLARATIYNLVRAGKFPPPIPLTESGRAVGWLESDINQYLRSRIDAARSSTNGGV